MTETINIWSGEAALYDETRPHAPPILLDICSQLIHLPKFPVVVDLGSGTGLSTILWAKRARQVIGIEPNAERTMSSAPGKSTSRFHRFPD